jgi:hypothetical protein
MIEAEESCCCLILPVLLGPDQGGDEDQDEGKVSDDVGGLHKVIVLKTG